MPIQVQLEKNHAEELIGLTLPTRRVEAFHYTDLRARLKAFEQAKIPDENDASKVVSTFNRLTENACVLHFCDGHMVKAEDMPKGVLADHSLPKAAQGVVAAEDAIIALNSKIATIGATISVSKAAQIAETIGLVHAHSGVQQVSAGFRNVLKVGEGAYVRFIERHVGNSNAEFLSSSFSSLVLEKGAKAEYFIVQQTGVETQHLARLDVTLAQESELTVFVLNAGGRLVRQEVHVRVEGENATLALKGVNLVGDGAHVDVTTVLDHQLPHTSAEELFRNVVTGDGHGVFQGQIKVAQPAQKTDAQMACNTLLLSDDSNFSAKPELEIFADDVICAHGATVADIDDDHLFYLKARGIREREARALLIKAFVDEVVEELETDTLGENLIDIIDNWLDRNL